MEPTYISLRLIWGFIFLGLFVVEYSSILVKYEINYYSIVHIGVPFIESDSSSPTLMESYYLIIITSIIFVSSQITVPATNAVQVDRYWSILQAYDQDETLSPSKSYAQGFIGVKFREDFKQLVYNINVNNIDNITGIFLYSHGPNLKNSTLILDLLEEAKEVQVRDKFKEASVMLSSKDEVEGTVAVGV